MLLKASY